jgi:hypothetical protein
MWLISGWVSFVISTIADLISTWLSHSESIVVLGYKKWIWIIFLTFDLLLVTSECLASLFARLLNMV